MLKQIPTKFVVLLILLVVGAVGYGGWRISQRKIVGPSGRGALNSSTDDRQTERNGDFETELMGSLANELDQADDLDRDQRDSAYEILKKADPVWKRVKQENSDAIQRANHRPRIIPPKVSAPVDEGNPFSSDPIE